MKRRAVKSFRCLQGITIDLPGAGAKSSLNAEDSNFAVKKLNVKIYRNDLGLQILYHDPLGEVCEQEVPNGLFHNVYYYADKGWENEMDGPIPLKAKKA